MKTSQYSSSNIFKMCDYASMNVDEEDKLQFQKTTEAPKNFDTFVNIFEDLKVDAKPVTNNFDLDKSKKRQLQNDLEKVKINPANHIEYLRLEYVALFKKKFVYLTGGDQLQTPELEKLFVDIYKQERRIEQYKPVHLIKL